MYYEHFGLKENPFKPTPDPRYLYLSRRHQEALDHLAYGITERKGFVMITGGVGTGKTTLLRSLLNSLGPGVKTALVLNPFISEEDLLPTLCEEFGVKVADQQAQDAPSRKAYLDALNGFLLDTFSQGGNAVLLLDEAQNLSRDVLEQVRILSNLETEKDKLLQIVLVGQEELVHLLAQPELRQLNDRIVVRYHLDSLEQEDVSAYVRHRMMVAGCKGRAPFAAGAWTALASASTGNPRKINAICDRALLAAYSKDEKQVSKKTLLMAVRDVTGAGTPTAREAARRSFPVAVPALAVLCVLLGAALAWVLGSSPSRPVPAQAPAPALVKKPPALPTAPAWTFSEKESLDLLSSLFKARSPETAGLFAFPANMELAKRFKRPFRVPVANAGKAGVAVVCGATPRGFLVLDQGGRRVEVPFGQAAPGPGSDLTWLVPESLGARQARTGSQGALVWWIQKALSGAGYVVEQDGAYGPRTAFAVSRFQQDFGIPANGSAGFQTIGLLFQLSETDPFIAVGPKP